MGTKIQLAARLERLSTPEPNSGCILWTGKLNHYAEYAEPVTVTAKGIDIMGTKRNPGKWDCYANADPDEEMFVLLDRDRHAAGLVRLWALLRHREGEDEAKVAEALSCADAMDRRARSLGKDPVKNAARFEELFFAATVGMAEHPEGFDYPCDCDLCRSYD